MTLDCLWYSPFQSQVRDWGYPGTDLVIQVFSKQGEALRLSTVTTTCDSSPYSIAHITITAPLACRLLLNSFLFFHNSWKLSQILVFFNSQVPQKLPFALLKWFSALLTHHTSSWYKASTTLEKLWSAIHCMIKQLGCHCGILKYKMLSLTSEKRGPIKLWSHWQAYICH